MNNTQRLYMKAVKERGRLLSGSEAFDFYTDHVMRNPVTCRYLPWANRGQGKFTDYELWELEQKAMQWHQRHIGSLVLGGILKVDI